uniref:Fucolectin tachylectin-4 pentraxin-1 domain-containing protein n=1 Tax=Labrus bergylta TaxID=56723 RepID=A0A3Q3GJT7_9LABR
HETQLRSASALLLGSCSTYAYVNTPPAPWSSADNAIDGNRDTNSGSGSCTHTLVEANPWWRGDCCAERLNGAEIHIGHSLEDNGVGNPLVGVISHVPAGRSLKVTFTKLVVGRYVTVTLTGPEKILSLCEVEVYGYHAPTGENLSTCIFYPEPLKM